MLYREGLYIENKEMLAFGEIPCYKYNLAQKIKGKNVFRVSVALSCTMFCCNKANQFWEIQNS